jgi:hypothetical protein
MKKRNEFVISVLKPEGKRPLRRAVLGWKDEVKMDFTEI